MDTNSEPLVSIIIVNYNGKSYLEKCLQSIMDNHYKKFEVIVVDNHSTDGSTELVRKKYPKVQIISLDKNYGFAEPNNIGAKNSKGEMLFFLNNDTKLCTDSIVELVKTLEKPEIDIAQSLLLKPDGKVDSSGDFLTSFGIAYSSKSMDSKIKEILSARGASFMVKKDVFWGLRGFDKNFFVSFEDVDLGLRAWIRGYTVVLVPSSIVYHVGGKTVATLDSIRFHGAKNTLVLCLANFELFYTAKILASLVGKIFEKKIMGSNFDKNSEELFTIPSIRIILQAVNWVLRNFNYVINKRKLVNSKRIRSTNDLVKLGLITNGRN